MPEQQTTARPDEAATTTSTPAKGALEERRRIGEITAIARQFDVPAADVSAAIEDGTTIDQFRRMTMELIQLRSRSSGPNFAGATRIAIQQERAEPYSLVRAVAAQVSDDWAEAGFEREVGEELRRIRGRAGRGALRPGRGPGEARPPHHGERRGADRHRAPRQPVRRRPAPGGAGDGARRHGADGPARDVSIPRQLTGTQAEWIAEDAAAAETQPTFDSVGLTLKQLSARSPLGRRQLKQSLPALDELLRNDLRRQIAIALDAAAINGAGGALEPLGILGTPGIGSLPLGDDGARSPGRAWSA